MPDFITQYALRRLFTQLRFPIVANDTRIAKGGSKSRLADDDTEDPDSGYCLDAPSFIPRGCIKRNPPGFPVIDVLDRN